MNLNRISSGLIFVGYVIAAFLLEGKASAFAFSIGFFGVLMLIWFGDIFGEYIGVAVGNGPAIDTPSPGWLVSAVAWVIFLSPLAFAAYKFVT
jgi:hypothetical protein